MTGRGGDQRLQALLAEPGLQALLTALNPPGEETRLVGGIVRSTLVDETTEDIDLATTLLPPDIMRRGEAMGWKAIPTGIEHGTVTLLRGSRGFEVTTLRRDIDTDGRHARVEFGRDFREDAARRDFTINAMSLGRDGTVHDYFGGRDDLLARHVRFIGDPDTRLREDYLRGLRFFRFSARYHDGPLDAPGLAAVIRQRDGFDILSRERIRQEFFKLVMVPGALPVMQQAETHGLISQLIGLDVSLSRFAARAILQARRPDMPWPALARLAALLADHARTSPDLQERLRLSNDEMKWMMQLSAAESLIRARPNHLAARLADGFPEVAAEALCLAAAEGNAESLLGLLPEVARHPRLMISGRDLMVAGFAPGPVIGARLAAFREAWIEAGSPGGEAEQRALLAQFLLGQRG